MEEENGEDTGDNDVDEISKRKTIIQELRNRIEHLEDEILRLSTAESITAASLSDMVSAAVALQLKKQQEDWNNIPLASSSNAEEEQQQEEYQPLRHSQKRWKTLRESFHASFQRSSTGGSRHADPSEDNNGHLQFNNAAAAMSRANNNLVFLHPEEVGKRNYTKEELDKIGCRPFPTRIYVTNVQLEIRDAFKADAITSNPPGTKYSITELLNMCYGMDESDYYSFACTVASAFSKCAQNATFERALLFHPFRLEQIIKERNVDRDNGKLNHGIDNFKGPLPSVSLDNIVNGDEEEQRLFLEQEERARRRLLQLMDIVFSKLKQKKILVDDAKHNIYRLVLCMTKYNRNQTPLVYAVFSFLLQLCAATYVVLSLTSIDESENILEIQGKAVIRNIFLSLGTLFYGVMLALPELKSTNEVYRCLYRSDFSVLAMMDFVVNAILPVSVALFGFFVVLQAETFLDGVLNVVALFFITEIDDQLPRLLELDIAEIVQGFLIDQAMEEYETQDLDKEIQPIQFSDIHVTNTKESGSIPSRGVTFQPYEVFGETSLKDTTDDTYSSMSFHRQPSTRRGGSRKSNKSISRVREGDMGQQVANKRSVTSDCLLRKIEWQYTGGYDDSTSPRIGHLRLHKLIDNSLIDIVGKQKDDNKPWFHLTGVYIITSFSMSDDILRLRVAGSQTTNDFLRAFKYYSLWPISHSALQLLKTKTIRLSPEEAFQNRIVLQGMKLPGSGIDISSANSRCGPIIVEEEELLEEQL